MERQVLAGMVAVAIICLLIGAGIGYVIKPAEIVPEYEVVNIHRRFAGEQISVIGYHVVAIDHLEEAIPEFERITGIDVELELVDEETMISKEVLDFTTHAGSYDVPLVGHRRLHEFAKAGYLEPLGDYLENKSDPEWFAKDDVMEVAWEGGTVDGEIYFVPVYINYALTVYREDIFEDLGIDPDTLSTTAGLLSACETIKDSEVDIVPYVGRSSAEISSVMNAIGWAWAYGAKLLDDEYYPQCNTSDFIDAMEDWVTLLKDYGPEGVTTMNWMDSQALLREGDAAITVETHDFGVYIDFGVPESPTYGKWDWYQPPKGPDGNYVQMYYLSGFGINADSEHKDAAWLFLQWFSDWAVQAEIIGEDYCFTSKKVLESSPFQFAGPNDFLQELSPAAEKLDVTYYPYIPEYSEIAIAFQEEVNKAVLGQKIVEDAMADANDRIYDILEGYGYYG